MPQPSKIVPHLWFDTQAREAAEFYCTLLPDSRLTNVTTLHDTPSGDCDVVSFALAGQPFMAISAGPLFRFNPSVSFLIACRSQEEVDAVWATLAADGTELMPLGKYPWSARYGWLNDRYGLSWQVMQTDGRNIRQRITPTLMFVGPVCGKAEEAVRFYTSVFRNAKVGDLTRYGSGDAPDLEGTVKHAGFTLEGYELAAMDSARMHGFQFSEAISLMVHCNDQAEIDYYWEKLTAGGDPNAQQCGWLKDRYGLSWQVTPRRLEEHLRGSKEQIARVTQAFLQMKKFDLAALDRAYRGGT
ncbi:MAG: VOC family protein [Gemmatimonadales bacterium]